MKNPFHKFLNYKRKIETEKPMEKKPCEKLQQVIQILKNEITLNDFLENEELLEELLDLAKKLREFHECC